MSIHIWRAMAKASKMGGYAGQEKTEDLWKYSKRELVEIALRLGEICSDEGGFDNALERVREERRTLRDNKII